MVRLVLVEDHELQLSGLKLILESQSAFKVVGCFQSADLLLSNIDKLTFDLALIDVHMPGMDGIALTTRLKSINPNFKVMLLTMQRGTRYWQKAEKAGANGYVLKNAPVEQLWEAIHTVLNHGVYIDPNVGLFPQEDDIHLKSTLTVQENPGEILSDREREILVLVCKEFSSSQIAEKLFISTGTVDTHRKNILVKLGVNNTVGLVKYALKHGLLNE